MSDRLAVAERVRVAIPRQIMAADRETIPPRGTSTEDLRTLSQAGALLCRGLMVYDNDTVYALAGNANDPELQQKIMTVKGDRRALNQPVGWTVPFERALRAADPGAVRNRALRRLLEEPALISGLAGAITFMKMPANIAQKYREDVPDSIIPPHGQLQVWSPEGSPRTAAFLTGALLAGVEPVMTSANLSGVQREIVTAADAITFAEDHEVMPFINRPDNEKNERPLGSYPILTVQARRLVLTRAGCFAPEIVGRIFHDYPFAVAKNVAQPHYPDNVLRLQDLAPDEQQLKGTELREAVLPYLTGEAA